MSMNFVSLTSAARTEDKRRKVVNLDLISWVEFHEHGDSSVYFGDYEVKPLHLDSKEADILWTYMSLRTNVRPTPR